MLRQVPGANIGANRSNVLKFYTKTQAMKNQWTLLLLVTFWMTSCKKDEFPIDKDTVQVTIKNTESYSYATGITGDEDGAAITRQANHYEVSELRRNEATNFEVKFVYQPKPNFSGKDYVEIETFTGSDGASSPTQKNTVKILIQVKE
jgi:hypothetical protein